MRGSMENLKADEAVDAAPVATIVIPSALVGYAGGRSHIGVPLGDAAGGAGAGAAGGSAGGSGSAVGSATGSPGAREESPRSPLGSVLDRLGREIPALERRIRDERGRVRGHVNIYVDGVDIRELGGIDTVIVPGATVQIIAAVSGG